MPASGQIRVPGSINAFPTSIGSLVLPLPSTRSSSKQIHHEVRVGLFIFWKRAERTSIEVALPSRTRRVVPQRTADVFVDAQTRVAF
ncbi:hypothetical protein CGMCC3_g10238 [Colletotrichum fructicola]|nr:uncharacterized protein CGMCC3_g10238 [Colletotrichum fructicola]KAE9573757.1 hypothetical protein CGMCC3_g10238 [Colletotrichum fructicola]